MVVNGTRFSSIKHTSDAIDCKTNFMVAIGGSSGEGNNKLAYSYDGINWTGVANSTSLFTTFTITAKTTFTIKMHTSASQAPNGLGHAAGISGVPETYLAGFIHKLK